MNTEVFLGQKRVCADVGFYIVLNRSHEGSRVVNVYCLENSGIQCWTDYDINSEPLIGHVDPRLLEILLNRKV